MHDARQTYIWEIMDAMGMRVRPVGPGDRAEWLRLRCALWPDGAGEHAAEIDEILRGDGPLAAVFVGAAPGGRLAGFLELSLRGYAEGCGFGPVPFVEGWYIDPEARGAGLGRALMAAAEAWARARGHAVLASDSVIDNAGGIRAHRALGFEEVERTVHFRKRLDAETTSSG